MLRSIFGFGQSQFRRSTVVHSGSRERSYRSPSGLPYAAGAIAVLFWGTTPAATVLIARDLQSSLVGPSRLLLAAAILVPLVLIFRPRLPDDRAGWFALAINGVVGFGASFFLQGVGFARTTTSHAALILAAAPVVTAIVQHLLSRTWPVSTWWMGSIIALIGESYLIMSRTIGAHSGQATIIGDAIVLLGTITVSIGYVAGSKLAARIGLFGATAWSIIFGSLFVVPFLPEIITQSFALSTVSFASLVFLSVCCTLIGFAAWFWALSEGGVSSIVPLQFAQPIVSFIIAIAFLKEEFSISIFIAVAVVILGVYICRRSTAPRPQPR